MSERIEGKQVDAYRSYLKEAHRPPSRGGNTGESGKANNR
jgi:hypothetical protein